MPPFPRLPTAITLFGLMAAANQAGAATLFVTCDNGLRCVRPPCPARDVVVLPSGKRHARAEPHLRLPAADRQILAAEDGLYFGTIVLEGTIAEGPPLRIVATRVARRASPQEAALCRRG